MGNNICDERRYSYAEIDGEILKSWGCNAYSAAVLVKRCGRWVFFSRHHEQKQAEAAERKARKQYDSVALVSMIAGED